MKCLANPQVTDPLGSDDRTETSPASPPQHRPPFTGDTPGHLAKTREGPRSGEPPNHTPAARRVPTPISSVCEGPEAGGPPTPQRPTAPRHPSRRCGGWPAACFVRRRDIASRQLRAHMSGRRHRHPGQPTHPPAPAPPPAEHTATNDQTPACVAAGQRHDSCIGSTTRAAGCGPTWLVGATVTGTVDAPACFFGCRARRCRWTVTRGRLVGILTAWRGGCRGDASPLFRAWRGWPSLRPRACRASRVGVRTFSCGLECRRACRLSPGSWRPWA